MARIMSLESGFKLCRLNHELLPEPGSPIARTTVPFDARGRCATGAAATGAASGFSSALGTATEAASELAGTDFDPGRLLPRPPLRRRLGRRASPDAPPALASGAAVSP